MEASNMLDVIHYFFEEDLRYSDSTEAEIHNRTRESIYQNMYGVKYKYAIDNENRKKDFDSYELDDSLEEEDSLADITPFNPRQKEVAVSKPYTAPSDFDPDLVNPFGNILDAPIN